MSFLRSRHVQNEWGWSGPGIVGEALGEGARLAGPVGCPPGGTGPEAGQEGSPDIPVGKGGRGGGGGRSTHHRGRSGVLSGLVWQPGPLVSTGLGGGVHGPLP